MKNHKNSDFFVYGIGIVIALFIGWKIIAYILPDKPVYTPETFLDAVMEASGGKDNWNAIQTISYRKEYTLFTKDSLIEISRNENHSYINEQQYNRIDWEAENIPYSLVKNGDSLYQYNNTIIDTTVTRKQLVNKLQSATFVLGLPYTLDTSPASLAYVGEQIFNGELAHRLEVRFDGSDDIWWLYYDDALNWLGYLVKTSDHYSLVINEEMQDISGFTLSRKRKSYRSDELMNILYLRATYEYSDFDIN